jgi:predicted RNase H-like nuclease (RuvC/YqgF family)
VIQDDEEVSALKERIMDMQAEMDRREAEYKEVVSHKDMEIRRLKKEVEQNQVDKEELRQK